MARANIVDQPREHLIRVEVLVRKLACAERVAPVVARNVFDPGRRLIRVCEGDDALPDRQHGGEPGVLDDDRSSSREITGRPATEPPWLAEHVTTLRNAPFRFRALDVAAIGIEIAASL